MYAEERQRKIINIIKDKEFCSLEELAKMFKTSVSTVRRDVNILREHGFLHRTHGGIRNIEQQEIGHFYDVIPNATLHADVKKNIAQACAALVEPGHTVIMDGGSTVFNVARYLVAKHPIVITNSLPIANFYSSFNQVEVHITGGVIYPRLGVLTGPNAVEGFCKIHADVAIMGAGGLTVNEGITNTHAPLIDMQLAMIQAAQKVIFCMDSTKLGNKSLFFLCPSNRIHTLVTDTGADPNIVQALREKGIEVCLVKP